MPVNVDDSARQFKADKKDLEIPGYVFKDEMKLICNDCQLEIEIPPDWTVSY